MTDFEIQLKFYRGAKVCPRMCSQTSLTLFSSQRFDVIAVNLCACNHQEDPRNTKFGASLYNLKRTLLMSYKNFEQKKTPICSSHQPVFLPRPNMDINCIWHSCFLGLLQLARMFRPLHNESFITVNIKRHKILNSSSHSF